VTLHDPVEVLHDGGRIEGGVALIIHLDQRHVLAADVEHRFEALA